MSRYALHNRLSSLPSSPGASPKGFRRAIKEITSKVSAHTDMSLCFIEFVAQSPVGLLRLSPRISSDLLQKRARSCKVLTPSRLSPEACTRRSSPRATQFGLNVSREHGVACNQQLPAQVSQKHTGTGQIWSLVAKLTLMAALMLGFSGLRKTAASAVLITFIILAKFLKERFRGLPLHLQVLPRSPLATIFTFGERNPLPNEAETKPAHEAVQRNESPTSKEERSSRAPKSDAGKLLKRELRHSFKKLSVQVPRGGGVCLQPDCWPTNPVQPCAKSREREGNESQWMARLRPGRSNSEASTRSRTWAGGQWGKGMRATIAIAMALAGLLWGPVAAVIAVSCWMLFCSSSSSSPTILSFSF